MSKTTRKTFPRPNTAGQPHYIFVEDGKIVATALDLWQAVKVYPDYPNAIAYDAYHHQGVSAFRGHLRNLRRMRHPKDNPVAGALCDLSNDFANELGAEFEKVIQEGSMGDSLNRGYVGSPGRSERVATNRECADWRDKMTVKFCFDLRKDLPKQLSGWLRSLSGKLLKAADRIAQVKDTRNKAYLHRLVDGTDVAEKSDVEEEVAA